MQNIAWFVKMVDPRGIDQKSLIFPYVCDITFQSEKQRVETDLKKAWNFFDGAAAGFTKVNI